MRSWKKRKPEASSPDSPGDERPKTSAYDRALGLLSRREHSARELSRKLKDRGHAADEAAEALAKVSERAYQSDVRYAESAIRKRVSAGYGPRYIEAELRSHGIDPKHLRELFDAIDWAAGACDQLRRKGLPVAAREDRIKASQYLARRGFDAAAIKAATGAAVDVGD